MNDVNEAEAHDEQTATDSSVEETTESATESGLPEKPSEPSAVTGNINEDLDDYHKMLDDALAAGSEAEGDEQEESVANEAEEEVDEAEESEVEAEQDADEADDEEVEAEEDEEEQVEAEGEEEVVDEEEQQVDDGPTRIRIKGKDEKDRAALLLLKSNPELSLDQAMEMARVQLGLPAESKVEQAEPEAEESSEPRLSVAEIKAQIRQKELDSIEAMSGEYDTDKWKEALEDKIALEDQLEEAIQAEQNEQAQFQRDFELHDQAAVAKYEANGITNPNSRFNQRMDEVNRAWEAQGDPRFYAVDKTMQIADMVSLELGQVAGKPPTGLKTPKATTKPTTTARKTQAAPKTASGKARTQKQRRQAWMQF